MLLVVKLVILLLVLGFGYYWGRQIPFADQMPLYEGLRTTCAIIFGVMGAWLAIIYPNIWSEFYKSKSKEDRKIKIKTISRLLWPLLLSTITIAIVLLISLVRTVISKMVISADIIIVLRGGSFAILSALTIFILWALLLSIVPAETIKDRMRRTNKSRHTIDAMMGQTQNSAPDEN